MSVVGLAAAGPCSSLSHENSLLSHVRVSLAHSAAAYAARGKVRLHVLFSTPRPAKDLYPFAHIDAYDAQKTTNSVPIEAFVEHIIMTASYAEEEDNENQSKQGRLMYALECFLYTLPKNKSSLLYVSKLDSSGWGPTPLPKHLHSLFLKRSQGDTFWDSSTSITRVITQAFLSYFASLSHWTTDKLPSIQHISIHILARAQAAYLFPSSNDNKGKHILSDGALIKWWRSVVSSVVCGVRRRKEDTDKIDASPFYLIPGYDRLESHELLPLPPPPSSYIEPNHILPVGNQALAEAGWVYGHPYSLKGANTKASLPPLPLSGPTFDMTDSASFHAGHIATLLPHFPDDPKSRFISELARDSYEHSAAPKRKAENSSSKGTHEDEATTKRARLYPDPEVTNKGSEEEKKPTISSITIKAMKERQSLDSVSPDEFWQRMGFRQECCAGNAVGVFVSLFTRTQSHDAEDLPREVEAEREMSSQSLALPHPIIPDLVRKHLMRDACDWSKPEGSRDLTKSWDEGVERAIRRKGGVSGGGEVKELGRNVIYSDVKLQGPTQEQVTEAILKHKENSNSATSIDTFAATTIAAPINTLSVKRKKKV